MPAYLGIATRDQKSWKKGDIVDTSAEGCSDDPTGFLA